MANKDMITLLRKLAEVGKEINAVPKNGTNEFQHYKYACEADFKQAVRKPFFEKGLSLIPKTIGRTNYETVNEKGKTNHYTDVEVEFTVFDGETGESVTGCGFGTGSDAGDKAIWKAYAGALKYWLAMSFMIPTGDDPENESPATNGNGHATPPATPPARENGNKAAQASLPVQNQSKPAPATNGTTNGNGKPNWSAFWPHMAELGLNNTEGKEYINLQASICFKVNGMVDKLTDVVKTQADLDLLDRAVVDAVLIRDGSRLPGED